MRYAFFGSSAIAPPIITDLFMAGMPPAVVICNPDRPAGRKKILTPPLAKLVAERHHIPVLQPENPADIAVDLDARGYECFVVAAYGKIMPQALIAIPSRGTIGVHPSLLPKYRGASPIKSAILDGALETGVTLYVMDEKMDHGPIIAQERLSDYVPDQNDNATLTERLAHLGAELLKKTLTPYLIGNITPEPQDHSHATMTRKFSAADGFVESDLLCAACAGENMQAAMRIHRMVLALSDEPGVWTIEQGKRKKILKTVLGRERLILRTVQYEGEKPREISEG